MRLFFRLVFDHQASGRPFDEPAADAMPMSFHLRRSCHQEADAWVRGALAENHAIHAFVREVRRFAAAWAERTLRFLAGRGSVALLCTETTPGATCARSDSPGTRHTRKLGARRLVYVLPAELLLALRVEGADPDDGE